MFDMNSIDFNENSFINIDARITNRVTANQLESILFIYGDSVLSYTIPNYMETLMKRHIPFVAKNCTKLECLIFSECAISYKYRYELLFMLPNLRHLMVLTKEGTLRNEALKAMIKLNLEILKIRGCTLSVEQLKDVCCIDRLKQLDISCHRVPIRNLLRLKQLKYLQVSFTFINNVQLLELVKGLHQLCSLSVRNGVYINQEFVKQAHAWMNHNIQMRPKLNIFLHNPSINWQEVDRSESINYDRLEIVELIES